MGHSNGTLAIDHATLASAAPAMYDLVFGLVTLITTIFSDSLSLNFLFDRYDVDNSDILSLQR